MKVQFENGYTAEMRDEMAKVYIAKGRVKKVEDKKPASKPAKKSEPKPEPKKESDKAE